MENVKTETLAKKQKLKPMNKAMLTTHMLNNTISIFVTTFLISYIYSISTNYVTNIGLFYACNYFSMMAFYYLISTIIDRTDRVTFYRLAIVVRAVFIICVVFWGAKLAKLVAVAGLLHGFSEACYWCSYNLMKNELVSKHAVAKYSGWQQATCEITNIVVPVTLGKIIDSAKFSTCAYIIVGFGVIELILSIFIRSKRPENSGFNMCGFIKDVKSKGYEGKLVAWTIVIAFMYGITNVLTTVKTIIIMYEFGSDFSLGIITSVVAIVTLLVIVAIRKFTKIGNRAVVFWISSLLPIPATLLLLLNVCKTTIIIYSFVNAICMVIHVMSYDVIRNIILKKLHLFDDIAEYQCSIECAMELARVVIFTIMVVFGLVGAHFGSIFTALKILMGVSIFIIPLLDLTLMVLEKRLKKIGLTED